MKGHDQEGTLIHRRCQNSSSFTKIYKEKWAMLFNNATSETGLVEQQQNK